jgi:hypothetical protein
MPDVPADATIQSLREAYQASKASQKKLKLISRVLTIIFLAIIVGFILAFYSKVQEMYAVENFDEPIKREAEILRLEIEPHVNLLWEETAPKYADLALQKFEEVLPEVEAESWRQLEMFQTTLTVRAETQINGMLDRMATKHTAQLARHFPNLATPEGVHNSAQQWKNIIDTDSGDILLHFHDLYIEDLGHLQATLERFRPNPYDEWDKDRLTREFIHLWLMRLDRLVLLGDEGEALDDGQ